MLSFNSARMCAVSLLFLLFFGSLAWAQGGATGAIGGVVQDESGAIIANAKVSVRSEATGEALRQVTTDTSGLFIATLLPVGTYTIEVSATGFPVTKFPGVVVRITETTRMTAVMKVAAVKEVVEVHSQMEQVNTTDATTGESLVAQTITELPLSTRNFQQLLALSAGSSSDLNNAAQLGRGLVYIDVNGGRTSNNNYLIDGISASDYVVEQLTSTPLPDPDAVEEFKVSTSLYDATQGRNGGGNINATLKSGTSKFHGNVWEYFRNTVLDANDYFLGQVVIKQNIFGGDFGGPIGPKAKLGYFYVNYQGTRQRSGDSPGTYIDSPFVPVLPVQRDQTTLLNTFFCGAACGGNTATSIDPVALALLNVKNNQFGSGVGGGWLFPSVAGTPGFTNGVLNTGTLTISTPGRFTDDQLTEAWDRDFRHGNDRLSERFFWSDSDTFEPFGAGSWGTHSGVPPSPDDLDFPLDVPLHSRFGSITETHVFNNKLVNEFRFGVNVISNELNNEAPVSGVALGISLPTANFDPEMYRFAFENFQFGPYQAQGTYALSDNFTWLDTLSWVHGKHQFRFGGEIDRVTLRRSLPIGDNGAVYFYAQATGYATDFQSFLAGAPLFGVGGSGLVAHDYRMPGLAWFAQDDYRVSNTLTLNLGFRNEFLGAPYDTLCHTGNSVFNLENQTGQPFVYPKCASQYHLAGITGTLNQAGLNNEYASVWEPRIGFAYDVAGHHTTSLRAGYGIYAVRESLQAMDNLALDPPFYSVAASWYPAPGLANVFAPTATYPGLLPMNAPLTQADVPIPSIFQGFSMSGCSFPLLTQCNANFSGNVINLSQLLVPLHWISPTTQQWNFTIERELGRRWFLDVGYVGTKGTHLRSAYELNQATLATPQHPVTIPYACTGGPGTCTIVDSTAENINARTPYLGVSPTSNYDYAPNSDSHYNGLQATLGHRFSQGLYFQGAYTFSKSIDDLSVDNSAANRYNDQFNGAGSRSLSDFDKRHRFVASYVYQLPSFAKASGLTKGALGGWEASGVITVQSGSPITVLDPNGGSAQDPGQGYATANFAPGYSCANAASSGSTRSRLANWVNPNAYQPDPYATLSTGGLSDATLYGDSWRNCIIGPPQSNVDFTLSKKFRLGERQDLRFRTDFFNLFNHPSFANPVEATLSGAGTGYAPITQTVGTPRLIQFSLKYSF